MTTAQIIILAVISVIFIVSIYNLTPEIPNKKQSNCMMISLFLFGMLVAVVIAETVVMNNIKTHQAK